MTDTRPPAPETCLYRFYDEADRLLYVGITRDPTRRFDEHQRTKPWWHTITTIRLERHKTRQAAARAEIAAIRSESPAHNIVHNTRSVRPTSSDLWHVANLRGGQRLTPLWYFWQLSGASISDNYRSDEIDAYELLSVWRRKHPEPVVPIWWFVEGDGIFEIAPFYTSDTPDFLDRYHWPARPKRPEASLNWLTLPVADGHWNTERATKGGFIQEALGWKPSVLQPAAPIEQLLRAADLDL